MDVSALFPNAASTAGASAAMASNRQLPQDLRDAAEHVTLFLAALITAFKSVLALAALVAALGMLQFWLLLCWLLAELLQFLAEFLRATFDDNNRDGGRPSGSGQATTTVIHETRADTSPKELEVPEGSLDPPTQTASDEDNTFRRMAAAQPASIFHTTSNILPAPKKNHTSTSKSGLKDPKAASASKSENTPPKAATQSTIYTADQLAEAAKFATEATHGRSSGKSSVKKVTFKPNEGMGLLTEASNNRQTAARANAPEPMPHVDHVEESGVKSNDGFIANMGVNVEPQNSAQRTVPPHLRKATAARTSSSDLNHTKTTGQDKSAHPSTTSSTAFADVSALNTVQGESNSPAVEFHALRTGASDDLHGSPEKQTVGLQGRSDAVTPYKFGTAFEDVDFLLPPTPSNTEMMKQYMSTASLKGIKEAYPSISTTQDYVVQRTAKSHEAPEPIRAEPTTDKIDRFADDSAVTAPLPTYEHPDLIGIDFHAPTGGRGDRSPFELIHIPTFYPGQIVSTPSPTTPNCVKQFVANVGQLVANGSPQIPQPPGLGNASPLFQAQFDAILREAQTVTPSSSKEGYKYGNESLAAQLREKAFPSANPGHIRGKHVNYAGFTFPSPAKTAEPPRSTEDESSEEFSYESLNPSPYAGNYNHSETFLPQARPMDHPKSEQRRKAVTSTPSAGSTELELPNQPNQKRKKRSLRQELSDLYREREVVRKRLCGTWTLDGMKALKEATEKYNMKRLQLAGCTRSGELTDLEAKAFPRLGERDLGPPLKARSRVITNLKSKKENVHKEKAESLPAVSREDTDDLSYTKRERAQMLEEAVQARKRYEAAYASVKDSTRDGRHLDVRSKPAARLKLAKGYYKTKREKLETAYPNGIPHDVQMEMWTFVDD